MTRDTQRAVVKDLGKALREALVVDTELPVRMQELLKKLAVSGQTGGEKS